MDITRKAQPINQKCTKCTIRNKNQLKQHICYIDNERLIHCFCLTSAFFQNHSRIRRKKWTVGYRYSWRRQHKTELMKTSGVWTIFHREQQSMSQI